MNGYHCSFNYIFYELVNVLISHKDGFQVMDVGRTCQGNSIGKESWQLNSIPLLLAATKLLLEFQFHKPAFQQLDFPWVPMLNWFSV